MIKPEAHQEAFWQKTAGASPFNSSGVQHLHILEHDEFPKIDERGFKNLDGWRITWEGKIPAEWDNGNNTMHGGAAAWIVDTCTSAAIMTHITKDFWGPPMPSGVSLAIDMSYYHPARIGTDILVEVQILKCSATTANLNCNIRDKKTRQLLSSGTHIKAWRAKSRAKL